ncbi:hypothetical protein [Anabaena sp. PCC 7108]|uniref:hypothetical protein n=1 Tax=Anabaena sp. PCC 7108 TaxID=163908 RepID=UPI00034672A2|nr:hypothetical protein [Anabaena sp. PCC 7108]
MNPLLNKTFCPLPSYFCLLQESGIRQGAPEAIQVADRFHLLQNLSQTLKQVFGSHAEALKEVEKQVFITDNKVPKEVETAHNLSLIAEANLSFFASLFCYEFRV